MSGRKILISLLLTAFISLQAGAMVDDEIIIKSTEEKTYSTGASNNAINQKALEEAQKAYSAPEAEQEIDIVPLFQDWTKREAQRKVNNIGNKLLISNNLENFARFEVSKKEVPNAHADFHGTIVVYKGLLEYVETEDELAYVIGHELAHITQDDPKKGLLRKVAVVSAAVGAGAIAGANSPRSHSARNAASVGSVTAVGGVLTARAFTKGAEARADKLGIDYMVKAGYNPLASISMMNKIMNRRWSGISDHPSGSKRMITAYQYIAKKYPKYLIAGYDSISYKRAMQYINKKLANTKKESEI